MMFQELFIYLEGICFVLLLILTIVLLNKVSKVMKQQVILENAIDNNSDAIKKIHDFECDNILKTMRDNSQELSLIKDGLVRNIGIQNDTRKSLAYICEPRIIVSDAVIGINSLFLTIENSGNGIAYDVSVNQGDELLFDDDSVSVKFLSSVTDRTIYQKERLMIKLSIVEKKQGILEVKELSFCITWKDFLNNEYTSQYNGYLDINKKECLFSKKDYFIYNKNKNTRCGND